MRRARRILEAKIKRWTRNYEQQAHQGSQCVVETYVLCELKSMRRYLRRR